MTKNAKPSIKTRINKILPNWFILVRGHLKTHGAVPNIISPVTFNEKFLSNTRWLLLAPYGGLRMC